MGGLWIWLVVEGIGECGVGGWVGDLWRAFGLIIVGLDGTLVCC